MPLVPATGCPIGGRAAPGVLQTVLPAARLRGPSAGGQLGLDESALIVARRELDDLRDELYVLSCAVHDVDRDLADAPTADDFRDAVRWLLDAARPLVATGSHFPGLDNQRP